jgi:uncharacterized damage-inducible protein DinB
MLDPARASNVRQAKTQLLDTYEREHDTTMKVLRAYPADQLELRPHAKCKTARELAWVFAMEQAMATSGLTTGIDWSAKGPKAPASMDAIITAFDDGHKKLMNIVRAMTDDDLDGTMKFFVAPKTMGDVPKLAFLWMLLHDQIHHRGQFSIYLRMAGGKLPSIYGPTADEPWN